MWNSMFVSFCSIMRTFVQDGICSSRCKSTVQSSRRLSHLFLGVGSLVNSVAAWRCLVLPLPLPLLKNLQQAEPCNEGRSAPPLLLLLPMSGRVTPAQNLQASFFSRQSDNESRLLSRTSSLTSRLSPLRHISLPSWQTKWTAVSTKSSPKRYHPLLPLTASRVRPDTN